MKNIFITGATGNVGKEVIKSLSSMKHDFSIIAGVRDTDKDKQHFAHSNVRLQHFDFEDSNTFLAAFSNCDILFLLRPPQIADVKKHFVPLLSAAKEACIKHIVFLSVQGAEDSKFIPHYKIEHVIIESGIPYTFIRPAYFMQNFTTTLRKELTEQQLIFLPAGKAKFTIIDIVDIGLVTATILLNIGEHCNKAYALTNREKLSFGEMAQMIGETIGTKISYKSPNLLHFYIKKRKEKVPAMFVFVMIMLHYLPRFQKEPEVTDWAKILTEKEPNTFKEFLCKNKDLLC